MATRFEAPESLGNLKDKVVVLSGGANGIGEGLVELCVARGANVCFGDVAVQGGARVAEKTNSSNPSSTAKATFVKVDVTKYDDILNLFNTALKTYGKVDIAFSCAGLVELPGWFDLNADIESVKKQPPTKVIDVNLTGSIFFAQIAIPYLRYNKGPNDDKSLTLLSSIAGFQESPGLVTYQASKHGVLGLMRSLRNHLRPTTGIRTNAICPFAVATAMTAGFIDAYRSANIPINEVPDTASIIAQVACEGTVNGEAFYLEGGRAWAFEGRIEGLKGQWLGEGLVGDIMKGGAILAADPSVWDRGAQKQAEQA